MQVKCPNCKALIEVDEENAFCPYCNALAHPDAILLSGGLVSKNTDDKIKPIRAEHTESARKKNYDDDDVVYHRPVKKKSHGAWIAFGIVVLIAAGYFLFKYM